MSERNPRVCIVTPVFNGAKFLDQTVLSLVSQAGRFRLRLHVQDGGSTDGTVEKIGAWAERLRAGAIPAVCDGIEFSWDSSRDRGMYDAINKGFAAIGVEGEDILGYLNSDDLLAPGAVQFACDRMAQFDGVHWIVSRPCECDGGGVMRKIHAPQIYNRELAQAGLQDDRHRSFLMQEGSFWKGWLWREAGGLRDDLRLAGDFDLWRRFAAHAAPYSCEQVLAVHRRHAEQLSAQADRYFDEIDHVALGEEGRAERDRVWAEYLEWVANPGRDARFAGGLIVYHPGPDKWALEERQPPVSLGPTLFVRTDGRSHAMTACERAEGFTAPEGPYLELRLPEGIRFAPPGESWLTVDAAERGSYWLLLRYRHFTPGLRVEVYEDGERRVSLTPPATDHQRDGLLCFSLLLGAGLNRIALRVSVPEGAGGPGLLVIGAEALPATAIFS